MFKYVKMKNIRNLLDETGKKRPVESFLGQRDIMSKNWTYGHYKLMVYYIIFIPCKYT